MSIGTNYLGDLDLMTDAEQMAFARRLAQEIEDLPDGAPVPYVQTVKDLARRFEMENAEIAFGLRLASDLGLLAIDGRFGEQTLAPAPASV